MPPEQAQAPRDPKDRLVAPRDADLTDSGQLPCHKRPSPACVAVLQRGLESAGDGEWGVRKGKLAS